MLEKVGSGRRILSARKAHRGDEIQGVNRLKATIRSRRQNLYRFKPLPMGGARKSKENFLDQDMIEGTQAWQP